jgi:hypothetical protein
MAQARNGALDEPFAADRTMPAMRHHFYWDALRHVLWDRLARWIGAEVRIGTSFEPRSPEPDDPVLATPMTWNVRPMA